MALAAPAVEVGLKRILVATDFSAPSNKAVQFAAAVARGYGAKVYLAHVVSALGFTLAGPDAACIAEEAAWRDLRLLEENLQRVGTLAGVTHEAIVCQGEVWEQLEQVAEREHVDLIVIGTHGRTGFRKVVMGSVAEKIFRHASCPVLTIGPGVPSEAPAVEQFHRILFPTDFGGASQHALSYAIALANSSHAKLVLLHVLSPMPVVETGPYWYLANDVNQRREIVRPAATERLRNLLPPGTRLFSSPQFEVVFDFPPEGIAAVAAEQKADLILMGVRGASLRTGNHIPWAVAHEVLCRAHCPVLTVHG
jgi:nucleotide-binding universal stress UspA family protein